MSLSGINHIAIVSIKTYHLRAWLNEYERMVTRPTIADLAKASGVSIATVDRVVNGRLPVRQDTVRRVYEAANEIGFHAASLIKSRLREQLPQFKIGFLLQKPEDAFYGEFSTRLETAVTETRRFRGVPIFSYWLSQSPDEIAERLTTLAKRANAIALVSPDHPTVASAIDDVRRRDIPVFSLLSDCAAGIRTSYVGVDNRKSGRTAAWMIAKVARRPGKVAIFVGSHRFHGQELREIGLRSFFRELAPEFTVLETLVNLESPDVTHDAMLELADRYSDFAGCYMAGGGLEGALSASRALAAENRPVIVCNELTPVSRAGLADGTLTLVISARLDRLCHELIEGIGQLLDGTESVPGQIFIPFELFTPENI